MKKIIVYLILLGCIFADEEIKTKYLSTNINILSGNYASINYGNITTNLEYNMSGRFSYQDIGYNNSDSYKTNTFRYQTSIRKKIKKTTLGLIDKNNFIGFGILLNGNYRKYDNGSNNHYKNERIGIKLIYGTKLAYNINEQLGLEIHLPYISGQLDYFLSESHSENKKYNTSLNFLNNALINLIFYY